jgi:hypothetical protein
MIICKEFYGIILPLISSDLDKIATDDDGNVHFDGK